MVAQHHVFSAQGVKVVLPDIYPAVRNGWVGENALVEYDGAGDAVMEDVVQRAFAGGVNDRDAHINRVDARTGKAGQFPAGFAGVAAGCDRLDCQHTAVVTVGGAGVVNRPAIGRDLVEAVVEVINDKTGDRCGWFGQRCAGWIDIDGRAAGIRVLGPE